jgi:predicted pyridoxine 5'-phosphate oxidase superfamily flavin-nucleotide-binding protein
MLVSDSVRNFVDQQSIVALATAAPEQMPNVAPIFWKFWYDEHTLLLLDNYMKTTKANIKATGTASVSVWNAESGEAYQLKGTAEYFTKGLHMDAAVAHMEKSKPGKRPKGVVVLRVSQIYIQAPGENAGEALK